MATFSNDRGKRCWTEKMMMPQAAQAAQAAQTSPVRKASELLLQVNSACARSSDWDTLAVNFLVASFGLELTGIN